MCRNLTGIDFILFDCELSIVKQIGVSPGNFNSYNSIINKSTNPDRSSVWQNFYPQVQENWAEKWLNLTNSKSFLTVNMNSYLAIIFMLTGMVPADEQDWVFSERDGREVGCVPRSGADAVLNVGSAFHGEELGGGRGTPENQTKAQFDDRCFIQHKHIVLNMRSTSKSAYFSPCTYEEVLWRTQTSHRL